MRIGNKISFLWTTWRTYGLKEAMRIGWTGFLHHGESRMILITLSDPRPLPDALEAAKTHDFRFATIAELEALCGTPAYGIAAIDIERVRNGTARCLLQLDGPKLAGYAWLWTHRLAYIEDGVHINLPDDTIYNYKAWTNPEYRGAGFQALRHRHLLRLTAPEGVKRLFGFVDHFNTKALRGHARSGYTPVGELRIRRRKGKVRMSLLVKDDFWSTKART